MLRGILNATQESIWLFDADGRIQMANETALRRLGKSPAEIVGHHPGEFMTPALAQFRHAYIQEVLRSKRPVEFEDERAGMAFQHSLYPVMDDSGTATCVVCYSRDITERRRTEKTLRQWADAFEHCAHGIAMGVPGANEILVCNPAFARLFGRPVNEICGAKILSLYAPEDQEHIRDKITEADRVGRSRYEARMVRADGSRFLVQMDVVSVFGADGTPIYRVATVQDITERKRTEEALRESQQFYQATIDALSAHVCVLNATGEIIAVNRAWRAFAEANLPVSANVSEGANYLAVCDAVTGSNAAEATIFAAGIRALLRSESSEFSLEYSCHSPKQQRWFTGRATRFAGAGPARVVVSHENITERKRLEAQLQDAVIRREALFEQTPIGLVIVDPLNGRILDFNAVAHKQLGYSREEFANLNLAQIEARETPAEVKVHIDRAFQDGQDEFFTQHRTKTGDLREMRVIVQRVDLAQGGVFKCIWEDITERKRLEEDWAQAMARLAVIQEEERGRISRDLHDQTAQQLVALSVELKNLETNLATGRPHGDSMQLLRRTVDDLQQQVRQIAWDLRAGEFRPGGLETALQSYVEEWSERAQVAVDYECRNLEGLRLSAPVEAAVYRVAQQALANVERHAQASRASVLLERDETMMRLTVEDDARGFEVESVQKSLESARRLGLLGMKERVTLAGGTLLIESSPEAGTTILVRIPMTMKGKTA